MPIYKDGNKKNMYGLQRYRVRVNYMDSFGKERQLTRIAYGRDEAKMLELRLTAEKKEPQTVLTVEALARLYLNDKEHNFRETTVDKNRTTLNLHILPFLGAITLQKLNVRTLTDWKRKIQDKKLSHRTNQNIFAELRTLLNWAVKYQYLTSNPLGAVDNFRNAYAPGKHEKIRYYTAKQFSNYIKAARADEEALGEYKYYMFFLIAFYTGMRKGEINALKWDCIEGNVIHVRRSVTQKLKGGDRETPPKNKSSYRSLQVPKILVQELKAHKNRNLGEYVCGGTAPLRDTTLDIKNRKYAQMSNNERITVHEFRHPYVKL